MKKRITKVADGYNFFFQTYENHRRPFQIISKHEFIRKDVPHITMQYTINTDSLDLKGFEELLRKPEETDVILQD